MTITKPKSVLIIGAGASADFGLPLGGPLLSEVRDELLFQVRQMKQSIWRNSQPDDYSYFFGNQKRKSAGFDTRDYPIWIWLSEKYQKNETENRNSNGSYHYQVRLAGMMESCAGLLNEQTSETIDDFIAMNPDTAEIVKLAIASTFYRILLPKTDRNTAIRKPLHSRYIEQQTDSSDKDNSRRNWVHLLINIVRHAAYNKTLHGGQKIRIISFNYDGILESILDSQFRNTGYPFKQWENYIEIVHPHGWMGKLPETCVNMKDTIELWASSINVVNEKDPNKAVKSDREIANNWIQDATDIYMTGFALSKPNAKLLGLESEDRKHTQRWHIHNYDGSPGLEYSARAFEREVEQEFRTIIRPDSNIFMDEPAVPPGSIEVSFEGGTKNIPMTIANWFQIGVPGEMPG